MIFSNVDIKKAIEDKEIVITPLDEESIGSASLDLSLGNDVLYYIKDGSAIDTDVPETYSNLKLISYQDKEIISIMPGAFILGVTKESVELSSGIAARIDGRSSLGRLGLAIHSTAGHIDPGFKGKIVLEISNIGVKAIHLHPGLKICQLVFEQLLTPTSIPYGKKKDAKYKKQETVTGSRL